MGGTLRRSSVNNTGSVRGRIFESLSTSVDHPTSSPAENEEDEMIGSGGRRLFVANPDPDYE
ncbi:16170_t:CDS:1, partial [Acaulospora colombiana]